MIFAMISAIENDSDKDFMLDVYDKYKQLVRKTIYRTLKTSKDIDDVTSETFIKLIEKISIIRSLSCHKLTAYIVITSKNTAIDYIKRRDVLNKHIYFGSEDDVSVELPDNAIEFEEQFLHQMDIDHLCQAIKKLPEGQKNILYFKYFLNMRDVEIAQTLGISPSSVPQYVKRARNAAKQLMGKEADIYAK
ncbi:MAG: sigma-70 family RNA polymerase sigma factor [Lawsonibacter sp.]|nr:sigma-70 family RNA polymerase sigma factor [Lawsonibacter sp.]